jgi:hypothetical protein
VNQGPRWDCLMKKKTRGRKSRDTVKCKMILALLALALQYRKNQWNEKPYNGKLKEQEDV